MSEQMPSDPERDGQVVLRVNGEMTVFAATDLRDKMMAGFKEAGGLVLDLREVDDCDVAGIQLILSARIYAEKTGTRFSVTHLSETVKDTLSRMGMDPAMVR